MQIKKLKLEAFRNYECVEAGFDNGLNIIVGENAQGKTNLLEAAAFLSRGRSFRVYRDGPLIKNGEQAAYITASVVSRGRDMTMEARLFAGNIGRKQLLINGIKLKNKGQLSGTLGTVLFEPDDIGLFRGPGQARRRFLDDAISQLSPAYAAATDRYEELLKRKNKILKDREIKPDLLNNLEDYNISMAKEGSLIIVKRAAYLKRLQAAAAAIHHEMSGGREELEINYKTLSNLDNPLSERETVYIKMREHQSSHERAELEAKTCLSGPHKDDFEVLFNGMSIKTFGSQGQNRSAVVSFKLAERELLSQELGEYPVLLLDDVLSELDSKRQGFILSKINQGQVFVTCCENERPQGFDHGRVIRISGGRLEECSFT